MNYIYEARIKQCEKVANKRDSDLKEKHPEIKEWCLSESGAMLKTQYHLQEINGELYIHYDEYNNNPYAKFETGNLIIHRVEKVIKFADTLEELQNEIKVD